MNDNNNMFAVCRHCRKLWRDHVDGIKCLYEPTTFEEESWKTADDFLAIVRKSDLTPREKRVLRQLVRESRELDTPW